MIYSKSWQGRFVSGRYTSLILLVMSLVMWVVGGVLDAPLSEIRFFGIGLGNWALRGATFLCFAVAAAMMSSWYVFEKRIRWFLSVCFCLPSFSVFLHGSLVNAFSLLFLLLVVYSLFECMQGEDNRRPLFSSFAVFASAAVLYPQFVVLLPVLLVYVLMVGTRGAREIFSILLGILLPYWSLFGVEFIFPEIEGVLNPQKDSLAYISSVAVALPSLPHAVLLSVGVLVLLPFVVTFSRSAVPGKPLLRKRLLFLAMMDFYLMALSLLYPNDYELYYIWSLPAMGVMISYLYSVGTNVFARYYFIVINIIWLALVPLSLWLRF